MQRQLKITPLRATGEPGSPTLFPLGCVHKLVTATRVKVYHPDDINPEWEALDDDEDRPSKYTMAYVEASYAHGMVIEYVDAETVDPKETVVSKDRIVVRYDDALSNDLFVKRWNSTVCLEPVGLEQATDFEDLPTAWDYMRQFKNSKWTILRVTSVSTLQDTGYSSEMVA